VLERLLRRETAGIISRGSCVRLDTLDTVDQLPVVLNREQSDNMQCHGIQEERHVKCIDCSSKV